jgi:signal transduction histidine kinase
MDAKLKKSYQKRASQNLKDFEMHEFLMLYHSLTIKTFLGMTLCILVIFYILQSEIKNIYSMVWLIVALLLNTTRIILKPNYKSINEHIKLVNFYYFLRSLIFSLPYFFIHELKDVDKIIITLIPLVLCTTATSTTSGHIKIFYWFVFPIMLSMTCGWLYAGFQSSSNFFEYYILSGLLLFYLIYLLGLGGDLSKIFKESCHLRYFEHEKNQQLSLALEEAKNASLAKTRFLASASHDLRQPMHTIGVLLAALGLRPLDNRSREIVQVLDTVNTSLSSQLDGLLDISKLDAGVVLPDLQVYRLDELIKTHVAKISLGEQKQNLYVRVHASQEVLVQTDSALFERVLMNLTGNAIKFTEQGGVDIAIHVTDQKAILEVSDTGIGIAPEMQQLVFQEFYQVGNSERDRSAGLGLGLSIVKRICELLDIHLQLLSAPGQGCRFVLSMPLIKGEAQAPAPKVDLSILELSHMKVLVIDDEVDIRTGMRLLLEELGCQVVLADGTEQAVAAAKKQKFDIIFSDYRLRGDENGIDAIGHVRVVQPDVDAVLITGDTAPERLQSAQNAGIQMLHKPVSFEAIVHQLQKVEAKI